MEILFIYNAKSDRMNAMIDFAHKIISPSTYACNLCKLTHSNYGEHEAWKAFMETSNTPLTFYHIDEFEKLYTQSYTYPIVLKKAENNLNVILKSHEIAQLASTNDLITAIKHHL